MAKKAELISLGFYPKIGAELEFYLKRETENIESFLKDTHTICSRMEFEKGWHQVEAVFEYSSDILTLAEQLYDAKAALSALASRHYMTADFTAKPYPEDYGSALHFHISLHNKRGFNYYSELEIERNNLLMNTIGGLLLTSPAAVYLLCENEADYARFQPNFMAPTHISWGGNNRTTVVRIPTSTPKHRRIEYRLPPASACPYRAIYVLLYSALYGIRNKIDPIARIWGNAFEEQYALQQLPTSKTIAHTIFSNSCFFNELSLKNEI